MLGGELAGRRAKRADDCNHNPIIAFGFVTSSWCGLVHVTLTCSMASMDAPAASAVVFSACFA